MIHMPKMVSTGMIFRKTNVGIGNCAVAQYNKFMKGVDRADQYLNNFSILRKTVR
jgi:hypothetical protein